jgi:ferredoxin-nitrate reductase
MTLLMTHTPMSTATSSRTKLRSAVCPYCGVGCRVTAEISGDRIVRVWADKNAAPNYGLLCQKGATLSAPGVWDTAGRLTHPMIRTSRTEPLRRVSWAEAATFIADRLSKIQRDFGRDAVAFYGSGQCDSEASYLFSKLFKGFLRTNNTDTNSRLCMSSAVAGYSESLGSDGPPTCYDDLNLADVVLIIGSNMAVNHPVLFNLMQRRRAGEGKPRVIVADPRKTKTAETADVYVPVKAGGDVAFIQLVAKGLMAAGRIDHDFITRSTDGFAAYKTQLQMLDDESLLEACGLTSEAIDAVVAELVDGGRFLSLYCQGANQSIAGVDKNVALINLHLQLGEIGKPGAGPFSLTGQPNAMGGREVGYLSHQLPGYRLIANPEHRAEMEKLWSIPAGSISDKPGYTAVPLFEAVGRGEIKAIWTACTNPVVSMPNADTIRAALKTAELVIHQDCYHPTETGLYADVLLPAAQWGEKTGTMTNSERLVARSEKFFNAPGDAMPDWWIVSRIAQALGFDGFDYVTSEQVWDEIRLATAGRPCDMYGMTNERLTAGPLRWPCPSLNHPGTDRRYTDGVFHTATGRAHFNVVVYQPPEETPSAEYPLALTTGRIASQWHTRTRTGRVAELSRQEPEPFIEIHPTDAAKYGVHDGQWVKLIGRRGSTCGRARVTECIRAGLLFMPFHWGFSPYTNTNVVTSPAVDRKSKQPELKFCSVRLQPLASSPLAGSFDTRTLTGDSRR